MARVKTRKSNRMSRIFWMALISLLVCCLAVMTAPALSGSTAADTDAVLTTTAAPDATDPDVAAPTSPVIDDPVTAEDTSEDDEEYQSKMFGTFWALVPPLVAIALALITKEVYSSLFLGIVVGALFYSDFNVVRTVTSTFEVMTGSIGDGWNVGILIFLVMLGILVALMTKAGGSAAYGRWAAGKIKTKRGAMLSTVGLGALIFVDDYFNCLTVGSVMTPVTDKHKISRAKLAYIIDATAAPICIIAPISSWAAAVTGSVEGSGMDGFSIFLKAIPYNFYALLSIVMLIALAVMKFDYGPMKKYEARAEETGALGEDASYGEAPVVSSKGKVIDLVLPVVVLILSCIAGMVYTGGFFSGTDFITAFADCDASVGLVLGSFVALVFTFLLYIPRRVISFKDFTSAIPEGFRSMVPPILILIFAWTLSGFCTGRLGADVFVETAIKGNAAASALLPAVMFLLAIGISFATGTSWGTFAILIPILLPLFPAGGEMLVIAISACLAGAVCGDHISPISDTTIMASAGARVNHIEHVSTQAPYGLTVAAVSFVGFLLAGFVQNWMIVLPIMVVMMIVVLMVIKAIAKRKAA